MQQLWYREPASIWEEALPLGNGRMGAMVFGKVENEQIQVNEESIWYGSPRDRMNYDAKDNLAKVRELLFEGNIEEAEKLMKWSFSGCPQSMPSYQTLGDILLTFEHGGETREYRRELDLADGICRTYYQKEGVAYSREMFLSYPADAMVMRLRASKAGKLNFTVNLNRGKNFFDGIAGIEDKGLCLYGNLGRGGYEYAMSLIACTDGKKCILGEHLIIREATEAVLYFTADSMYRYGKQQKEEAIAAFGAESDEQFYNTGSYCEEEMREKRMQYCFQKMMQHNLYEKLKKIAAVSYEILKQEHIEDYKTLFDRVVFTLKGGEDQESLPVNERLAAIAEGAEDIGLSKLYLDFGRYLLIACSRPGCLPANLQGVWNKELKPAWESKYTININTEMNYWLAENGNLPECHMPLFDMIQRMVPNGERTALQMYGCGGFVAHHNTDIHGDCMVQDYWNPGSYWVMGAAWLCTHQWKHYVYTQDKAFLAEAFPIMRKAAAFFKDFLVEHEGHLVTCPSVSPENTFLLPNGHKGANLYGVTMDNQILRDLFEQCIKAGEVLGVEDALHEWIKEAVQKLIPTQISGEGYIMEWPEDFQELEMGHRHISHLYGLHPSEQITMDETPKLAEAAAVTLERRLKNGGGHTGWSRAWIINHYAKLWNGEKAYENLKQLYAKSTYPNLFDKHPPFQIDGNFGAAAAILEMLVQSNEKRAVLLPALPNAWHTGSIRGVCVHGGGMIDMEWQDGNLCCAKVNAVHDLVITVVYRGRKHTASVGAGSSMNLKPEDFH